MRVIFISILSLLVAPVIIYGQQVSIDSLQNCLKNTPADTAKIDLYIELGVAFQNVNLDSSVIIFNKALSITEQALTMLNTKDTQHSLMQIKQGKILRLIGITLNECGNYKLALNKLTQALALFESLNEEKLQAICLRNMGVSNCELGNYDLAREFYDRAITFNQKQQNHTDLAKCYSLIGNSYNYQGKYDQATTYYLKALKTHEQNQNKEGMSACYTNMGGIAYYCKNYKKAIDLYSKSLTIDSLLGDKSGVSINYNNIGLVYTDLKQFSKAIEYYNKSIEICRELGEINGLTDGYNNIGLAYKDSGQWMLSVNYLLKSLELAKEFNDPNATITTQVNLADLYLNMANQSVNINKNESLTLALNYGKQAFESAQIHNLVQLQNFAAKSLMTIYEKTGNQSLAFKYAKVFITTTDTMFRKEKTDAIADMEAKYQNEKKQKEIEILEKDNIINQEKAQKQKIIIASALFSLGLLVFIITFVLRRLQITRRQKRIIEKNNEQLSDLNDEIIAQSYEIEAQRDMVIDQKEEIEKIHKELSQSIDYAQRLQSAMLPDIRFLNKLATEHFILFKPKDKVSGDFYWWAVVENQFVIAVADCTGHGVPGAFMSMLGSSFLREIVVKEYITKPSIILQRLRKEIIFALKQKGELNEHKDGMDMALVSINIDTLEMEFAGANNPCWIVTHPENNSNGQPAMHELAPDKMPISIYLKMNNYTNQTYQLKRGDCLYFTTDGYKDQFGGPNHRKFLVKQMKELLLTIASKPMNEQKQILLNSFNSWKGQSEQIDDVTVLGFKI